MRKSSTIYRLQKLAEQVKQGQTVEEVFGYEGQAASRYFEALGHLLNFAMGFGHRIKHPPTDPVNSLLSFGYALAFYNLYALIRARGLHPYVGHLHAVRDGHPALASDLLEEFRAPVVDSLVLYLVNSKIVTEPDFYRASEGEQRAGCYLRDAARKTFLKHFEQRMASPIVHPGTGESVDWRRAMDLQVAHMLQRIRGEVNTYIPLEIR